jgi:hypothetical protein
MRKIFLLVFSLIIVISCSDNPVNNGDNLKPGRRDYEWTIDTLKAPPGNWYNLYKIWGSSPQDIWAAGTGDAGYTIWHYDGNDWRPYPEWTRGFLGIWGFAKDDIWACGGSQIYHFDGNKWALKNSFDLPGYKGISFNDIWGESPTNILAVGSASTEETFIAKGVILKYDGNKGQFAELPDLPVAFGRIRKDKNENHFLYGLRVGGGIVPDSNKIFIYNSNGLKELWSGIEIANVSDMNGDVYLSIQKYIYKYKDNKLTLWKDFTSTSFLSGIRGRTESDFFCASNDGLAHYNGSDLVTLYPTDLFLNDVFVFEKDVFILANNRIIIHGKLIE